jgi:hypothetical protein
VSGAVSRPSPFGYDVRGVRARNFAVPYGARAGRLACKRWSAAVSASDSLTSSLSQGMSGSPHQVMKGARNNVTVRGGHLERRRHGAEPAFARILLVIDLRFRP